MVGKEKCNYCCDYDFEIEVMKNGQYRIVKQISQHKQEIIKEGSIDNDLAFLISFIKKHGEISNYYISCPDHSIPHINEIDKKIINIDRQLIKYKNYIKTFVA